MDNPEKTEGVIKNGQSRENRRCNQEWTIHVMKNGQSRETMATFGTEDTGRRQTKELTQHWKLKIWPTRTPQKNRGEPRRSRRVSISSSYKTPNSIRKTIAILWWKIWTSKCYYFYKREARHDNSFSTLKQLYVRNSMHYFFSHKLLCICLFVGFIL